MNAIDTILHLGTWGQHHSQEVLTGLLAAPLLLGGVSLLVRRRRGETEVMGSARWATPREVKKAGLYGQEGLVIGRLKGQLLCDHGETLGWSWAYAQRRYAIRSCCSRTGLWDDTHRGLRPGRSAKPSSPSWRNRWTHL
jgi:hypothetical protein